MTRELGGFLAVAGATLFAYWNPAIAQTPMAPCLAVDAPAPATCGSTSGPTGGPASDPFPRTFLLFVGGNPGLAVSGNTQAGVPFSTVAAQYNMVDVGFYLGFEASYGTTAAELMKSWKSAAQANGITLRTFQYTPGFAPYYGSNGTWHWLNNALASSNMYAYTSASGSGTSDLATFNGYSQQGVLALTPANTQTVRSFTYNGRSGVNAGLNVWQVYTQYYYDAYVNGLASSKYGDAAAAANPYLDGVQYDNMTPGAQQVSSNATWNGPGTSPVGDTANTVAAIQQGDAKLVKAMLAINPNFLVVGNTGWADSTPAFDPSNQSLWPVIMQEEMIGESYSVETWANSPPGGFMQKLIQAEATIRPGGTLVFHQDGGPGGTNILTGNQSSWGATQWRAVRYGFAAAMQRNWHYACSGGQGNYSTALLFDEQVQGGKYGWLSAGTQRLDPPQSSAWSNGVWRRRYPNGWVLWNPRGNGAQTVTIPSTLCRIHSRGYGDSAVNSGACGATTVTLQDADGLFLIGTG